MRTGHEGCLWGQWLITEANGRIRIWPANDSKRAWYWSIDSISVILRGPITIPDLWRDVDYRYSLLLSIWHSVSTDTAIATFVFFRINEWMVLFYQKKNKTILSKINLLERIIDVCTSFWRGSEMKSKQTKNCILHTPRLVLREWPYRAIKIGKSIRDKSERRVMMNRTSQTNLAFHQRWIDA